MKFKMLAIWIFNLIVVCLPLNTLAKPLQTLEKSQQPFKPRVNVFVGGTQLQTKSGLNQTFSGTDGNIFDYSDNATKQSIGYFGISLALDYPLSQKLMLQTSFEYHYLNSISANGTSTVGITPATSTPYTYQYTLQIQQTLIKAKLLATEFTSILQKTLSPYIAVGIGPTFNSFKAFNTATQATGSINLTPTFEDHLKSTLSYGAEIGIDAAITSKAKLALGYRFMNYGSASSELGQVTINTVNIPVNFALKSPTIYTNQLFISLHYELI